MATEFDPSELQSLAAKLSSGEVTSEEHARLEQMLRNSPAARQHWFLICDVENGLHDWAEFAMQRNEFSMVEPKLSRPEPQRDASRIRMRGNLWVTITLLALISITLMAGKVSRWQTDRMEQGA